MLTRLTCLALLALAAPVHADPATTRTQEDARRVWYHDGLLAIAQRDLWTAQLEVATTRAQWDQAVAAGDAPRAGRWAVRHLDALLARRDATGRVLLHRAEHEIARADFNRDADTVRAEARIAHRKRG